MRAVIITSEQAIPNAAQNIRNIPMTVTRQMSPNFRTKGDLTLLDCGSIDGVRINEQIGALVQAVRQHSL